MKINKFIKSIYGRKMYDHVIPLMVLAFGGAVGQFTATQYLGLIIDAVAEGYDETISYFCRIAVPCWSILSVLGHLLSSAAKPPQDLSVVCRPELA